MVTIQTDLRQTIESAKRIRFEPSSPITATNVQDAISQAQAIFLPAPTPVNFAMSPYLAKATDRVILVDTSGGAVSIVLPLASSRGGLDLEVKDDTGFADANNITVSFTGGEKRDGVAPVIINNPFGYARFNPQTGGYYET